MISSSVRKPKLEIMTSVEVTDNWAMMSDELSYVIPEFRAYPVGTRFAVLREMDVILFGGVIQQVLVIL